ncbi:MAG: hypothetical protein WC759_01100, partial [Candidatus Micrarchaeia archaeon]
EKALNFASYPGIFLEQLSKVQAATNAIGVNQGNPLYIIVETALSFTLLPFALSIAGLYLILHKRATSVYPAAALFAFLLLESSLITFLSHGEQRYTTRLFPMLAIFLAVSLDYIFCYLSSRSGHGRYLAIALSLLLILSSYYMVHHLLLPGLPVHPYSNRMLTVDSPASEGFTLDYVTAAGSGYYFITEALHSYGGSYGRVFTNTDSSKFAEYVRIIEGKELYNLNEETKAQLRGTDLIIMLRHAAEGEYNGSYLRHNYYNFNFRMGSEVRSINVHVYLMTPAHFSEFYASMLSQAST